MINKEKYLQQMHTAELEILDLPWRDKEFYANFLAQTYYFVRHSTRLLARSMSHFQVDRENLYRRFLSHISEEDSHEKIALSDLKKLGYTIEDFPETAQTKAFWQSQYYLTDTTKGTALLGYILFLEAIAVETFPKIVDHLYKHHQKKCCQFVKVHVEEDPDHVQHAIQEIEKLSEAEQVEIWSNFDQTSRLYCEMLKDLSSTKDKKGEVISMISTVVDENLKPINSPN